MMGILFVKTIWYFAPVVNKLRSTVCLDVKIYFKTIPKLTFISSMGYEAITNYHRKKDATIERIPK